MLTKNALNVKKYIKLTKEEFEVIADFEYDGIYSRPTVTLLEDNSVLALKDEKDIKIVAVL